MKGIMLKNKMEKKFTNGKIIAFPSWFQFSIKKFFDALATNSNMNGICFKSNTFLRPGTTVYVRIKQFLPDTARESAFEGLRSATLGEIKWCKELVDTDTCTYEVGVKYPGPAY